MTYRNIMFALAFLALVGGCGVGLVFLLGVQVVQVPAPPGAPAAPGGGGGNAVPGKEAK